MGEERGTYVEEESCIQGFGVGSLMERTHGRPCGRWDGGIQMNFQEIV